MAYNYTAGQTHTPTKIKYYTVHCMVFADKVFCILFHQYCFIYTEVCLYYLLRIGPQDKDEYSSIMAKLWMRLMLQLNLCVLRTTPIAVNDK